MAKQAVEKTEYARGLEGVVTNETAVGYVDGVKGQLVYRGYSVEDLAEHSSYEETAYLLLLESFRPSRSWMVLRRNSSAIGPSPARPSMS